MPELHLLAVNKVIIFHMELKPPKQINHIDYYHGQSVQDPYHYMEDPEDPETQRFVQENNALVEKTINKEHLSYYTQVLEEIMGYQKLVVPTKRHDRIFYARQEEHQLQPIIYMREGLRGEEKVVMDLNSLSEDGTTSSMVQSYSNDGRFLAAFITEGGSDWQKILVKDIDNDQLLESLSWVTLSEIAWNTDGSGFYYPRFPDQTGLSPQEQRRDAKLFFHKVGTNQSEDVLVYNPDDVEEGPSASTFDNGQWLVVDLSNSTLPENRIMVREEPNGQFKWVVDKYDGCKYEALGVVDNTLYLLTSAGAEKNRVVKLDLSRPEREFWEEIIPETDHVLHNGVIVNRHLVLTYEVDVKHELRLYSLSGEYLRAIPLPTFGTLTSGNYNPPITGNEDGDDLFFGFASFLLPMTVYHFNFRTNSVEEFLSPGVQLATEDLAVNQVFYSSHDGTRVPMYLIGRKDLKRDGSIPTVLYGYGGFNTSQLPNFSAKIYAWVTSGGLFAMANIRGGGEYGKQWHEQALLEKKQTVFDDFIAAAEYLISERYTSNAHLGINGRSNGGLLVGAVLTQRPELFGAAIPQVGVLDMLRYTVQKDAGRYWTKEYGDATKHRQHFEFLIKYSPYHNIKGSTVYPPTLVTAAEGDDRVAPMHSKKFAAALQSAQMGDAPILLRIEDKAGHGYGKPLSKTIEDTAIDLAFLKEHLSS